MQTDVTNDVLETYTKSFVFPRAQIPEHYREITIQIQMYRGHVIDTVVIISYNSRFEWFLESDVAFQPEFGLYYQGIPRYAKWDVVEIQGKNRFIIPLDQGGNREDPPSVVKKIINHFTAKKIFKPTTDYLERYDVKLAGRQIRGAMMPASDASAASAAGFNTPFNFKYEEDRARAQYNRNFRGFTSEDQVELPPMLPKGNHSPIDLPEHFQRTGGPPTPSSPEEPSLGALELNPLEMRGRNQSRISVSPVRIGDQSRSLDISPIRTPPTPENPNLLMTKLSTPKNLFGRGKKTKRRRKTKRKKSIHLI